MQPFKYVQAVDPRNAVALARSEARTAYIAGGTNLVDLMKLDVEKPSLLIDINALPLRSIQSREGKLHIGALALNSDAAHDPLISRDYPLLAEALLSGASPQLRNMATIGGNLLQRTRCYYFNDRSFACNKREPGSGCAALEGFNRIHAILGTSSSCIATHPSDMAVALTALNADVVIQSGTQEKRIPIRGFYREPGTTPQKENVLEHGDLILGVEIAENLKGRKGRYVKIRDRSSYAFALASAAVLLKTDGSRIESAHLALGGVGTKPWHRAEAEIALNGGKAGDELFNKAADLALAGAKAQKMNAFKIELAKRALKEALISATSEG